MITKNGVHYFSCKHCRKEYKSDGGTRNMTILLKTAHRWNSDATGRTKKREQERLTVVAALQRGHEAMEERRSQGLVEKLINRTTLEFLFILWIVADNLPFEFVSHPKFRALLEYINPSVNRVLSDSSTTIRTHAAAIFKKGKKRLRSILSRALSDIHITCDVWTSSNHLALLAVVGHYTTDQLERRQTLLALRELHDQHSGVNMAELILNVLRDFKILNKVGYFVMDNIKNNNTLTDHFANILNQKEGVQYNPWQRRLRCNGYIINLAVRELLFGKQVDDYEQPDGNYSKSTDAQSQQWRKLGPLEKLHNINPYIMSSPQRIQAFKKLSNNLMSRRDNSTRWNSWYEMMDWATRRIKQAIISYTSEEPDLADDTLLASDWRTINNICSFLRNFHDATKTTEGWQATLNIVLPTMDFSIECFEDEIRRFDHDEFKRASLKTGLSKILAYWNNTERAPIYIAAIALNPYHKTHYFVDWKPQWQPDMRHALKVFWETTYRSSIGLPARPTSSRGRETNNTYYQ